MRFLAAVALALLLATSAASAQSPATFPLKIKVTDPTTAVIPNATVSIAPTSESLSPAGKPIVLKTGYNGTATAKLKPGTYVVTISVFRFSRVYEQVSIPGKTSLVIGLKIASYHGPVLVRMNPNQILSPESLPLHHLIPEISHAFLPASRGSSR